jgi:hypothetical protein
MSAYIPALGAIAVAVFTAIWGAIIYPRQKAVDRQNYADQKAIDRDEYAAQKKTDREIELRNRRMGLGLTRLHGPIRVKRSGSVKGVKDGQERQALLA